MIAEYFLLINGVRYQTYVSALFDNKLCFLASQDALEVMLVSESVSESVSDTVEPT